MGKALEAKQAKPPSPAETKEEPKPSTTQVLEPVTFTFAEGKPVAAQQIPEFEKKPEEKPGTTAATLAEERKAGTSAIAALILPLFEMWNRSLEGQPALPADAKDMRLTKDDAENLAQAVLLVDAKHGGILSKSLGSEEYGAELFLAGVSVGIGFKMWMGLRLKKPKGRPSAAPPLPEEKKQNPLEKAAETLKNALTPKTQPKTEQVEIQPGALSAEDFMKVAEDYQKKSITP